MVNNAVRIKTPKGTFDYSLSDRKDKKLKVLIDGRYIHFGDLNYSHFFDKTGLLDPKLNHHDKDRRKMYLKRATYITDKHHNMTAEDINSPNYHSINILW
jgi:hypothetical protein